ncbi:MAG: response regulator [Gemmatimonadota bacterium]
MPLDAQLEASAALAPLVLIANDQEWTARAVESILVANGFRVVRSFTARETLALANASDPDVVILDQQLPDFSGVEVCRRLRADPRFGTSLPILITTAGPSGRQQRLSAYGAGAWEFYGQPLDAEALLHKLRVYSESYAEVRRLRHGNLIDPVTGLYSRVGLARRATELLGEARRNGRAVACVAWSVEHVAGSDRAPEIGEQLRIQGRAADAFGRLDNGEFAVVAPGTDAQGAEVLAERFRDVIARAYDADRAAVRTTILSEDISGATPSGNGEHLLDRLTHALAA